MNRRQRKKVKSKSMPVMSDKPMPIYLDLSKYKIGMSMQTSYEDILKLKGWKIVNTFDDCPPLNKKVQALHDNRLYIGKIVKVGSDSYCWELIDGEWVDIYDVDAWRNITDLCNGTCPIDIRKLWS